MIPSLTTKLSEPLQESHPMKSFHALTTLGLAAALLSVGTPTLAGEGHDHGNAAPGATGSALPRFAAVSETFELVGVLDGKQVTLYLDRFADNAPVRGARIELEVAGVKFKAETHGDDAYEVVLSEAPKPGVLPVIATVTVGAEVDLLVGELDLHEAVHATAPAHEHGWKAFAGWTAGGLAGLAVLVIGARRLMPTRQIRAGGAA